MGGKRLDLKRSVHSLCKEYPELAEILVEIGFKDIIKPGMLESVGRFMTLPKGAAAKKLDIGTIKQKLAEHGFSVEE